MDIITRSPIISICIPTYNRCALLEKTIDSIISQEVFQTTADIEIVISDNASTDQTREICLKYLDQYPDKVIYHRNDANIFEENFDKVLSLGKGVYLKLNNDTFLHKNGSLITMINAVKGTDLSKSVLIFNFGNRIGNTQLNSADELLNYLGNHVTWIAIFGLSKKQFAEKKEKFSKETLLGQVNIFLELSKTYKVIKIISCENYFESMSVNKKGGYDLITVFVDNYLCILRRYFENGEISKNTYLNQKRNVVFGLVLPYISDQVIGVNDNIFEFKKRQIKLTWVLFPDLFLLFKYWFFEINLFMKRCK